MVDKITIGPLKVPARKLKKGQLLSLHLPFPIDRDIDVPPSDITLWPEITLLPAITVFDPDWTTGIVQGMMPAIIESVFKAVEPYLDKLAEEYYAHEGKE